MSVSPPFSHKQIGIVLFRNNFTSFWGLWWHGKRKQIKIVFVTYRLSNSYKWRSRRCSFALQKGTFWCVKGHVLQRKRASFTMQKTPFYFLIWISFTIECLCTMSEKGWQRNHKGASYSGKSFGLVRQIHVLQHPYDYPLKYR